MEITDYAVNTVMNTLMAEQVEILSRFNSPLRDEYMAELRSLVRTTLTIALTTEGN